MWRRYTWLGFHLTGGGIHPSRQIYGQAGMKFYPQPRNGEICIKPMHSLIPQAEKTCGGCSKNTPHRWGSENPLKNGISTSSPQLSRVIHSFSRVIHISGRWCFRDDHHIWETKYRKSICEGVFIYTFVDDFTLFSKTCTPEKVDQVDML
jgi:hypothetical protein